MKKTRDGRRRFSREFKIAAVRRVQEGELTIEVARDLSMAYQVLWRWTRQVSAKGEEELHEWGRPKSQGHEASEVSPQRRIAELERLAGRQQMEIRFLERALRRVEELRQRPNGGGGRASSKG
jgi:transposase-like protein